ncbi:hypothetical protein AB205_0184710 [Aquarana catesbeiana]|uniref:Uncharacterized protein n=1 Tax=Aquarana catesbeiana TaxID=8400 RepID=A0A2G9RK23_AQUCT|nr:hypothetical protein AB205_0184710 [Aquarana catesbeiana]
MAFVATFYLHWYLRSNFSNAFFFFKYIVNGRDQQPLTMMRRARAPGGHAGTYFWDHILVRDPRVIQPPYSRHLAMGQLVTG